MLFLLSLFNREQFTYSIVLSKPASYSPALFSVPVKIREQAYQSFIIVSRYRESTAVVQVQHVSGCGKSTIKVRRKYAGSKAYVRLKYGKLKVQALGHSRSVCDTESIPVCCKST